MLIRKIGHCSMRAFGLAELLIKSGRPLSSCLGGSIAFLAVSVRAGSLAKAAVVGLIMFSTAMFGFIVNDIMDFDKDRAAGVKRPIARRLVSLRTAAVYSFFLVAAIVLLTSRVRSGWYIVAATVVGLIVYTPIARFFPLVKEIYVAALAITPLVYADAVCHSHVSLQACLLIGTFITGRELVMDAQEMEGDIRHGMDTLPSYIGQFATQYVGSGMMVAAVIFLCCIAHGAVGETTAICAALSLTCLIVWPRLRADTRIAWTRLPMMLTVIALAMT